jgi:hypothetical protein
MHDHHHVFLWTHFHMRPAIEMMFHLLVIRSHESPASRRWHAKIAGCMVVIHLVSPHGLHACTEEVSCQVISFLVIL